MVDKTRPNIADERKSKKGRYTAVSAAPRFDDAVESLNRDWLNSRVLP
jgi:hypothetical protein